MARVAAYGEVEAAVETAGEVVDEREKDGAGEEDVGDRRVAEAERTVAGGEKGIIGARRARPFRVFASRWAEGAEVDEVEKEAEEAPLRLLRADDCRESRLPLGVDDVEGEVEAGFEADAGPKAEAGLDGECLNGCGSGSSAGDECLGWLLWVESRPVGAPGEAGEALKLGIGVVVVLLVLEAVMGELGEARAAPLDVLAAELSPAEKPEAGFCIGRTCKLPLGLAGRRGWWMSMGERTRNGRR